MIHVTDSLLLFTQEMLVNQLELKKFLYNNQTDCTGVSKEGKMVHVSICINLNFRFSMQT